MLFNHFRGSSWSDKPYSGPVGRWDNLSIKDGKLVGDAVLDENDPLGKQLNDKLENDFIRAASVGLRITEVSQDPKYLLKGQTRPTVTKCDLVEVSLVDIPANKNALALYDLAGEPIGLSTSEDLNKLNEFVPLLNNDPPMKKLSFKAGWLSLLAFFSLSVPEGQETVEAELSEDQLEKLNAELAENAQLKTDLQAAKDESTRLTGELKAVNDSTTAALKKAKLDETLKGAAAHEALAARVEEFGKLSGKFPKESSQDTPPATEEEEFLTDADREMRALYNESK